MKIKTFVYNPIRKRLEIEYENGRKATYVGDLALKVYLDIVNKFKSI